MKGFFILLLVLPYIYGKTYLVDTIDQKKVGPTNDYRMIKPKWVKKANPCPHGKPLTDASGSQLFCGRGPNRQDCPSDSSCLIHPTDKYAVCCTDGDGYGHTPFPDFPTVSGCGLACVGRPFIVQGRSRTTSSLRCSSANVKHAESWKMGDAPLVLSNNPYNQKIGRNWLKQAEAEHASVASFARFTLQLISIGAPSRLLVASQEASIDEVKHAKMCYGFASAFIGSDLGPGSLDVNGSLESIDIKNIIRSLVIEGCIGETLSAVEAHLAAHNAEDTAIKAAVSQLASDETKHAQLAWDTIKWIIEKYPASRTFAEKIFLVELKQHMMPMRNDSSLLPATLCEDAKKVTSFRRYGLLVSADRDKVREVGIRDIIEPIYRAGFKGANMISKQIIELDFATLAHEAAIHDRIEPSYPPGFNDVDMISKQITEQDVVTF